MFFNLKNVKEITTGLHPSYLGQIDAAGPLLGVLSFSAKLSRQSHPIIQSPVSANLTDAKFGYWKDISSHLKSFEARGTQAMGRSVFKKWVSEISKKSGDEHILLAWSILTFLESHIRSSSEANRQVLLNLVNSIVENNEEVISGAFPIKRDQISNAKFVIPLIAGKTAFSLILHSEETLNNWSLELEAATVLLIPQVILLVLAAQMQTTSDWMKQALKEEVSMWRAGPSSIDEFVDWKWLPSFGI